MTRRLAPALKRLAFENRAKGNIKKKDLLARMILLLMDF